MVVNLKDTVLQFVRSVQGSDGVVWDRIGSKSFSPLLRFPLRDWSKQSNLLGVCPDDLNVLCNGKIVYLLSDVPKSLT